MRIHALQHVQFDGLAAITNAMAHGGHQLTTTHWYLQRHYESERAA